MGAFLRKREHVETDLTHALVERLGYPCVRHRIVHREEDAAGAIKAIGAGINEWQVAETLARSGDFDVFLLAGRYTLLAGIRDPGSERMSIVRMPLDVPKYEGGNLMLSTVALVSKLQGPQAPPAVGEGKKAPFFLGSFRVVPSLDGVFRQGSEVAWYFQIYNAVPEPATGRPNLTFEYNFLLKQKGEFRPVAAPLVEPNRTSQIGAFSFQLIKPTPTTKGWVEGEYKVAIKVTDTVTRNTVSQEIFFRVVP